jgi:hypothetical protein
METQMEAHERLMRGSGNLILQVKHLTINNRKPNVSSELETHETLRGSWNLKWRLLRDSEAHERFRYETHMRLYDWFILNKFHKITQLTQITDSNCISDYPDMLFCQTKKHVRSLHISALQP